MFSPRSTILMAVAALFVASCDAGPQGLPVTYTAAYGCPTDGNACGYVNRAPIDTNRKCGSFTSDITGTDINNDPAHCGNCWTACTQGQVCESGTCAQACSPGRIACSGAACVDTDFDNLHCGGCNRPCFYGETNTDLTKFHVGVCRIGVCVDNTVQCFKQGPSWQMCGNVCMQVTDNANCGACGKACAVGQTCVGGRHCACPAGRVLCDKACIDLLSDNANCGACGKECTQGKVCAAGVCSMKCEAPLTTCSGRCIDTGKDALNCGACGTVCRLPNVAVQSCVAGKCVASAQACDPGFGNCDNNDANGCESEFATNSKHCGACDTACADTFVCDGGRCVPGMSLCPPGSGDCDSDGNTGPNGCETNTNTDLGNCGACGRACTTLNGTPACNQGVCAIGQCNANFGDCNMNPKDGCEADLNLDTLNCGACGKACSVNNATAACTVGICSIAACNPGFADCNMMAADGCETNTNTINNCGACGMACTTLNGTPACNQGVCAIGQCNANFGDCNMNPKDGCEADLNLDANNCGACGKACAQGSACYNGACYTLAGQFAVTDKNAPLWNDPNTVAMSCVEVCAQKFGAGVYACSTQNGIVNGQAWTQCNGGGNSNHCTKPVDQAYKKGVKYDCGGNDCACSSYVDYQNNDGCPGATNNCYKQ